MAVLVKICPSCGKSNPLSNRYCDNPACGASLLRVTPTVPGVVPVENRTPVSTCVPESTPVQQEPTPSVAVGTSSRKYVKVCPECGKVCKPIANRCECGRHLFDITPTIADESQKMNAETHRPAQSSPVQNHASYMLRSEDGRLELLLPEGEEVVIGREGLGADYLAPKGFVGRRHLLVLQKDGFVTITHISKTNPTLVNDKEIESNKPFKVNDNDLIVLGAQEGQPPVQYAAYFRLIRR